VRCGQSRGWGWKSQHGGPHGAGRPHVASGPALRNGLLPAARAGAAALGAGATPESSSPHCSPQRPPCWGSVPAELLECSQSPCQLRALPAPSAASGSRRRASAAEELGTAAAWAPEARGKHRQALQIPLPTGGTQGGREIRGAAGCAGQPAPAFGDKTAPVAS